MKSSRGLNMKFWRCFAAAFVCGWLTAPPASADTIATFSVDVTFPVVAGLELTGTFDWNLTSNTVNPNFMLTNFAQPPTSPFVITRPVITAFSATPHPGVEEFVFVHDFGNAIRVAVGFVIPFDPAAALAPGPFPLLSSIQTDLPLDSGFFTCDPSGCAEVGAAPAGSTIELTAVTTTPAAVPLHPSIVSEIIGLAMLGLLARRRKQKQLAA
jgi:hypothetical protein